MQNTTMKHTPGPWLVHGPYDAEYEICAGPSGQLIVRVEPDEANNTQTLFNAHLIAAAPELFESLQAVVACISETRGMPAYDALAKARAAIAKASNRTDY